MRDEGRPPEHEIPAQRAQELAPEHMVEIFVDCRTDTSFGARLPISGVGRAMLDGQVDFGPGLRQIRIELHQAAGAPTHPRIRLQQAKGVLSIVFPSALSEDKFTDRDAYTELFREGIDAVLEALEAARERVTDEMPEFDFDALVERCRSIRDRVPETADELDALIENADVKARTLRVAMSRLQEQNRDRSR